MNMNLGLINASGVDKVFKNEIFEMFAGRMAMGVIMKSLVNVASP